MFIILMFVVSMAIAGCAAFFSVKGIGLLFAGSFISVIIMASCLEAGKLMAASFLYRHWNNLAKWLKWYLSSAVILLMGITSMGIYGFLSDAYETTKTKVDLYTSQIDNLNGANTVIQEEIDNIKNSHSLTKTEKSKSIESYRSIYDNFVQQQQARILQLNSRVSVLDKELNDLRSTPGGLFSSKDKKVDELILHQQSERDSIASQLLLIDTNIENEYSKFIEKVDSITVTSAGIDITTKVDSLYAKLAKNKQSIFAATISISETDIGSFKFIARSFGVETDTAVKWFTLIIVLVFDPLAVSLIIGYNILLNNRHLYNDSNTVKNTALLSRGRPQGEEA